MTAPSHSLHRPRGRRFSVEPLEDRLLLSGLAAQPVGAHVSPPIDVRATDRVVLSDRVQLLEIGPAEEDGDTEREIPIEQLPRQVVSALAARFPGAELVAAALDDEDEPLSYGLIAQWNGVELELTVAHDGNVIEVEETLTPSDLPEAVRSWIATNFPGASISEADFVAADDAASYDLLFTTSTQQLLEATLLVTNGTAAGADSPNPLDAEPVTLANANDTTRRSVGDPASARRPEPSSGAADSGPLPTAAKDQRQSSVREFGGSKDQPDQVREDQASPAPPRSTKTAEELEAGIAVDANDRPVLLSGPPRPRVANTAAANPATLLPHFAQALGEFLPFEVSALERGLREFLDDVDALVDGITMSGSETSSFTPQVLIVAVVLLETQRVLHEMRKRRRERVFAAVAESATWTWGPHRVSWSHTPLR